MPRPIDQPEGAAHTGAGARRKLARHPRRAEDSWSRSGDPRCAHRRPRPSRDPASLRSSQHGRVREPARRSRGQGDRACRLGEQLGIGGSAREPCSPTRMRSPRSRPCPKKPGRGYIPYTNRRLPLAHRRLLQRPRGDVCDRSSCIACCAAARGGEAAAPRSRCRLHPVARCRSGVRARAFRTRRAHDPGERGSPRRRAPRAGGPRVLGAPRERSTCATRHA